MCCGARVPAQGRRGGAALLRGLPPAGHDPGEEPARQRAVGQEPLPQGREHLHRQDLRDDHARGDRRRRRRQLARRRAAAGRSTSASSRIRRPHGDLRQDVRLGGAGPRHPAAGALRPQRRARRARRRAVDVRRRRVAGQTVLTGLHAAGAHVHRRQAPRVLPRRALHQEPLPDARRAEGHALRRRSRSSRRTSPCPPDMAQAVNTTAQELVKYMQPVQRDWLRLVVQKFIEDGAKADLKRWMQAVEVTAAARASSSARDLEIAKKIIARRAAAARRSLAAGEAEGAHRLLASASSTSRCARRSASPSASVDDAGRERPGPRYYRAAERPIVTMRPQTAVPRDNRAASSPIPQAFRFA